MSICLLLIRQPHKIWFLQPPTASLFSMKLCRFLLACALLALAVPALAADQHEAYLVTNATNVVISSSTYTTILSITSKAVNTGTNSYILTAVIPYVESQGVDGNVSFELTAGSTVLQTWAVRGGPGYIVLRAETESVASSTVLAVKAKCNNTNVTLTIPPGATFDDLGLSGNTQ